MTHEISTDREICDAEPVETWLRTSAREIEREVVGAALHGPLALESIQTLVDATDFAFHAHRVVYGALRAIHEAGGEPGPATVYQRLSGTPAIADLGDNPGYFLADLYELAGSGANGRYYAERLREIAIRRDVSRTLENGLYEINETKKPTGDVIGTVEEQLFQLGNVDHSPRTREVAPLKKAADKLYERLNEKNPVPETYYPTGFEAMDNLLGGFRPGRLYVLAARPGVGKSALALAFVLNASSSGVGSLIFSLEMDADEIMQRALAIRSGVPLSRIMDPRGLTGDDYRDIVNANGVGGVYIEDSPTLKASQLSSITRLASRRHDVRLVVVDYLQLLTPENPREPRYLQVGGDTRRLKQLARSCNVPVVCLCQLNREVADDAEPSIAQLRDSGEIEQNADVVILLWRESQDQASQSQAIRGKIAKQRNGMTGQFTLDYRRACVRFENRSYF